MWNGDPQWWEGTSPVLFPIIGGLHKGVYRFQGKEYSLGSHGFARKKLFDVVSCSSQAVSFKLNADEDTRNVFPFEFSLTVTFAMDFSGISVRYEVVNLSSAGEMFFSIGSHPAFRLPFDEGILENYYLHFDQPEHALRYYFSNGCLTEETGEAFNNSRQIFLTRKLFDKGPLIFKDIASKEVSICKSRGNRRITVHFDTPYLALWSKPKGAPFVCIEPWSGLPDPVGFNGTIEQKPGIQSLKPGETFTSGFSISLQ